MLDWFKESITSGDHLAFGPLAIRLLVSLVFGAVVAGIYVLTQRRSRSDLLPLATTLVLLTVLITMVTLVIGNNIARAFSLAGALAIIRFRTVVEDTRDTAFVIFAVVVGMGVGASSQNDEYGLIIIPLIGTPIVAAAALALSYCGTSTPLPQAANEYSLAIRLGLGRDPSGLLKDIFAKHLSNVRLRGTTTARQGAALDLLYSVRLQREEDTVTFVTDLNQIEGVQNVELRQM
jgi:hypothetical protein